MTFINEMLPYVIIGAAFGISNAMVFIAFKFSELIQELKKLNKLLENKEKK